ncbi:hypothetical protein AND_004916 [Anopheles darlingi]|uniref:Uncharacterized protein n=1 Tax=Anopheles darlingi TaxID=43151 RepID=W5JJD3_ANODA|nr:hypothetical protein AND_004916 [Anopheles darlingi]
MTSAPNPPGLQQRQFGDKFGAGRVLCERDGGKTNGRRIGEEVVEAARVKGKRGEIFYSLCLIGTVIIVIVVMGVHDGVDAYYFNSSPSSSSSSSSSWSRLLRSTAAAATAATSGSCFLHRKRRSSQGNQAPQEPPPPTSSVEWCARAHFCFLVSSSGPGTRRAKPFAESDF